MPRRLPNRRRTRLCRTRPPGLCAHRKHLAIQAATRRGERRRGDLQRCAQRPLCRGWRPLEHRPRVAGWSVGVPSWWREGRRIARHQLRATPAVGARHWRVMQAKPPAWPAFNIGVMTPNALSCHRLHPSDSVALAAAHRHGYEAVGRGHTGAPSPLPRTSDSRERRRCAS